MACSPGRPKTPLRGSRASDHHGRDGHAFPVVVASDCVQPTEARTAARTARHRPAPPAPAGRPRDPPSTAPPALSLGPSRRLERRNSSLHRTVVHTEEPGRAFPGRGPDRQRARRRTEGRSRVELPSRGRTGHCSRDSRGTDPLGTGVAANRPPGTEGGDAEAPAGAPRHHAQTRGGAPGPPSSQEAGYGWRRTPRGQSH